MMNNLPILAIETSGELCSVAAMLDEKYFIESNIKGKHVHSEKIFDMIDYVLKNSKIELNEFNHIAVSMGPGSFTGLRIGLSAAKGLALGSNLPIVPVPTFEVMAFEISEKMIEGKKLAILKSAGIDDFYFATYETEKNGYRKIEGVSLIHKNEINEKIKGIDIIFADKDIAHEIKIITGPHASYVALWSYSFGKDLLTYDYDYLEPYYLKQFIARVKK